METEQLVGLVECYRAVLDGLPDPLVILDGSRTVVRTNQAARTLFGKTVLGDDLAATLDAPALLDAVDRVLTGDLLAEAEFTYPAIAPQLFRARLKRLPVQAADGSLVVLALHDLTAVKRAERMRADFVANASHELRTPLTSLLGYIETLQGAARDDVHAQQVFLGIMHHSAQRMARLVSDLLSLSRIEFDEHLPPGTPIHLSEVLGSVVDSLAPLAEERSMQVFVELPPDLPPVPGAEEQFIQLFVNLVDNALKYGRPSTAVRVAARHLETPGAPASDVHVAVSVSNQGDGIGPEHLPRLTERFFRCDASRSRELGGTGLGLAIVKHILNRHRGQLTVDSVVGQGSTFTVTLPGFAASGSPVERSSRE